MSDDPRQRKTAPSKRPLGPGDTLADHPSAASPPVAPKLTHVDSDGRVRMVDISGKPRGIRSARAEGRVVMAPETLRAISAGGVPKGDVFSCAKIAAISAAKRTDELIPLCHRLALQWTDVRFALGTDHLRIESSAVAEDATGVEMEALTAVSVAALTVYDMCKAIDKQMRIEGIRLLEKQGGKQDFSSTLKDVHEPQDQR